MKLKPGMRFHSDFFKSDGTVASYVNDKMWWFTLDRFGPEVIFQAHSTPDKLTWLEEKKDE